MRFDSFQEMADQLMTKLHEANILYDYTRNNVHPSSQQLNVHKELWFVKKQ